MLIFNIFQLPAPRDEISVVDEQFEKDMNGHADTEHCPEDGITEMPCKLDEMTHLQDRHCHPQVNNKKKYIYLVKELVLFSIFTKVAILISIQYLYNIIHIFNMSIYLLLSPLC